MSHSSAGFGLQIGSYKSSQLSTLGLSSAKPANQLSSLARSARVMKDSTGWQLHLRKHRAQPPACWPELHHHGEHFVVGQPQAAFEVVVTPPVGALQPGQFATVSSCVTGAACCAACAKHDPNTSSAGSRTGVVPAEMTLFAAGCLEG